MPFNGSGLFVPLPPPTYPPVPGTTISSAYYTAVMEDLMAGLTNCVTRDGQGAMSVAFNAGGQKVINMAAPTNGGDGANKTYVDAQDAGVLASAAASATSLYLRKANTSTWPTLDVLGSVIGMLAWKQFGAGHVIFDASNGTSPSGVLVNSSNSVSQWVVGSPTLMGWNGSSTYGVRVDSCRRADSAAVADTATNATTSLGNGQTWQDVSGSRAANTDYTNTTGRAIQVSVNASPNNASNSLILLVGGVGVSQQTNNAVGSINCVSAVIPPGGVYQAQTTAMNSLNWMELR